MSWTSVGADWIWVQQLKFGDCLADPCGNAAWWGFKRADAQDVWLRQQGTLTVLIYRTRQMRVTCQYYAGELGQTGNLDVCFFRVTCRKNLQLHIVTVWFL